MSFEAVDPNRDMTPSGWRKELTWQEVSDDPTKGKWYLTEVDFRVSEFTCHTCGTNEYLWLVAGRSGVMLACLGCETVDGPITLETGRGIGEGGAKIKKEISPLEAYMILKTRDGFISKRLARMAGKIKTPAKFKGKRPESKF